MSTPSDMKSRQDSEPAICNQDSKFGQVLLLAVLSSLAVLPWLYKTPFGDSAPNVGRDNRLDSLLECSLAAYDTSALNEPLVEALPVEEYIERRDRLARALVEEGLDAFVGEPGFTEVYYTNLSSFQWESWEPEERPFLMVVEPVLGIADTTNSEPKVVARTTFLTPAFELQRALALNMPLANGTMSYATWEEHEDPFAILSEYLYRYAATRIQPRRLSQTSGRDGEKEAAIFPKPLVVADDEMRLFIAQGLVASGLEVVPYSYTAAYALVKQLKSPREIALLRAVNTLTITAIRAVHNCLPSFLSLPSARDRTSTPFFSRFFHATGLSTPKAKHSKASISELELSLTLDEVMRRGAGMDPFFDLVLFGPNAACPHCSSSPDVILNPDEDMILIDVGSHLYGYSSDVCRTFFASSNSSSYRSSSSTKMELEEKLSIWSTVLDAQAAAIHALSLPDATASSIDLAARGVISDAGYGVYFTHRLGHGIGIKAHEPPYLNKGNTGTVLKPGMVFTAEPGIYIEGVFGVRHEDIILITEDGVDILSGVLPTSPWEP
ncbi:Creatinase/aminopeptidase [Stereum hirsutum FP-91666 SS1]|uniref:Creatinase/aminopeptidase n=1 Tax=Stereum hirsutum (strain FP-91666) TaxID=721885 RepID=UPI000440E761|nr:Creatinase/aminopeptidase [Stereum hirsutum FP-91666 SS1]EIM87180.1 Creatinase/aminopeptidase [Stereum hirsutum FP-91666 SS1]